MTVSGPARSLIPTLALALELGLALRLLAADAIHYFTQNRGVLDLFPDTEIYWQLAQDIHAGDVFEVSQWGIPHFALRAPIYPAFLALCQSLFGLNTLPVRIVQAALGTLSVLLAYCLVKSLASPDSSDPDSTGRATVALTALAVAIDPYSVLFSVVLLSESVFLPLMLGGLWGLGILWGRELKRWDAVLVSLAIGVVWGLGVLTKPSWCVFPVLALSGWMIWPSPLRRTRAVRLSLSVVAGLLLVMAPWWVRNAEVFGHFVPTVLWMGASLYDGLNPEATGSSDMRFLEEREFWPLHETAQDQVLKRSAMAYALSHPGRAVQLALIKAGHFWSPWPSSETLSAPGLRPLFGLVVIPCYVLILYGAWLCRKQPRMLLLLAGPLLYFAAVHCVFVSSIRYRAIGMVPAFGLGAIGLEGISRVITGREPRKIASLGLPQ